MHSRTFDATDEVAARIDELQFDLGEGPGWDAVTSAAPVLISDLHEGSQKRWPIFSNAAEAVPARALFVFPMIVRQVSFGALTLYRSTPGPLPTAVLRNAPVLAGTLAAEAARMILTPGPIRVDRALDRSQIYQATGVVMAQLGLPAVTAFARIQAHAFTTDTSMAQVAYAVITHRLRISDDRC
jgi:GAF domain-containing protein